MDAERARAFLLTLPHVVETQQWGDNLVFWVGDKAIGGKMFALLNLDTDAKGVVSFSAGPEGFAELVELEGLFPAPYMARINWVAAERWSALRDRDWQQHFHTAHQITLNKLPRRTRDLLALPTRQRETLITARRKLLASRAAAKKQAKP